MLPANAKIKDMQLQPKMTAITVAATLLLVGSSVAQQTSTTTSKPATAKSSTAAKPATATAAKPRAATTTGAPLTLKTEKEKLSYAIGMNIGQGMKHDGIDIDPAILTRALKDALAGSKPAMTEEEAKTIMNGFRAEMIKKQQDQAQKLAETNKAAGDKFLAENKSKTGVVTLPSGLQYKIIKEGTGPKPTATDTVVTNYRGTLINGTEFDSSYKRGEPASFPVNRVIKGWTEALQLMPVGSKWQLYVPANLAYGDRSPGGEIGPNSTLIFDVELLSIEQPKAAEQKPAEPKAEEPKKQ
jgi:FKBP-type peptidyl-prolyl cis-trans isomerase